MHVGQCLPKLCSLNDFTRIMTQDPAYIAMQQIDKMKQEEKKLFDFEVLNARNVPGPYSSWQDKKLYGFAWVKLLKKKSIFLIAEKFSASLF